MNEKILKIGREKFKELSQRYGGFINIIIDDWRGYRFIFDTEDVRRCQNDCQNCQLFKLLAKEEPGLFSAGLYLASEDDKKIFGPQRYLDCKTLEQYRQCYLNFLGGLKSLEDRNQELALVRNLALIYCREGNRAEKESTFKNSILWRYKS